MIRFGIPFPKTRTVHLIEMFESEHEILASRNTIRLISKQTPFAEMRALRIGLTLFQLIC